MPHREPPGPRDRPTILIVDDAPSNIQVLANLLRRDYRVKVAGSGAKALEIARQHPHPDLILLDISMPEMDGYEVCRALKADPATLGIPVIFVSSAADDQSETQGLQLGAVDYLTKPINPGITLLRVGNQLALKHLQDGLRLFESVFEHSREGIVVTDADENIIDTNAAFTRITGYSRAEVLGRSPRVLRSGRHGREFFEAMWQAIITAGHWDGEIWNRRKNGEIYPQRMSISALCDETGQVVHYISLFSDISVYKQHEKQLEFTAHYDALTGIPNRVLLGDRLRQAIAQARRDALRLAVCYLDLDGFKAVNDQLGHEAGDQVLIEMARRIRNTLRDVDTVARLGGDEFVILLVGLEETREFGLILSRLLQSITRPASVGNRSFALTASIGVTLFPQDSEEADTLLRHADQAMYIAKQSGKNRYHVYDPDQDRHERDRRELSKRIGEGLAAGEFELHFQPTIDLASGRPAGAEALIRWRHPGRGLLFPGDFLPAVANSDLDIQLGQWVIEAALSQLQGWQSAGLELRLGVNVSAGHLQSPGFLQDLQDALERHPWLPPGRLEIEVLETATLEDIFGVRGIIETCAGWGVGFALDDFGTGYSSLSYLRSLPVATLKIDPSFVRGMLADPGDLAIVRGIIGLAQAFGRATVAEGVESPDTAKALRDLGCERCQGYGIAEPMAAGEFFEWCGKYGGG
jgi:diguanylate cyclase (GGDEF)-like protein/PAS domain S-box-containing protein